MIIPDRAARPGQPLGFAARSALRTYKQLLECELGSAEAARLNRVLLGQTLGIPEDEKQEYNNRVLEIIRVKFPRR